MKSLTDYGVELCHCPTCGAEPGARCVTAKGHDKPPSESHMARWVHLGAVFWDGYDEGQRDARSLL